MGLLTVAYLDDKIDKIDDCKKVTVSNGLITITTYDFRDIFIPIVNVRTFESDNSLTIQIDN